MGKYDLGIQTEYKSKFVDPGLDTFKEAAINYRSRFEKNQSVTIKITNNYEEISHLLYVSFYHIFFM